MTNNVRKKTQKYFFNRKECIFIFRSDNEEIIDFIRSCRDIFHKQLFDSVLQTILVPSSNRKTGLLFPIERSLQSWIKSSLGLFSGLSN